MIDFDNVSSSGLSGWDNLGSTAHIIIFHASNTKTMKIDIDMLNIVKNVNLETIEVPQGNQSVDKHIISYMGYLIGNKGNNCQIVIISGDKGYENIINFWKSRGAKNISFAGNIAALAKKAAPTPKKPTAKAKKADLNTPPKDTPTIESRLKAAGCPKDVIQDILSMWEKNKNKTHRKSIIHNELISKCGNDKGKVYYNHIKKLLK